LALACISRITRERSACPATSSPTPAICPSHHPEARAPLDEGREVGELLGGAQRGAAGADADPAAERPQGGVHLQADPDLLGAVAARGVDEVELRGVVQHHADRGGQLGVRGEFGVAGAVGGGVGEQDVAETGAGQPDRLRQCVAHDPGEAVAGEHPGEEFAAADGLAGDPDRLAGGAADQVVGVGVEGFEIDDRERGVQVGGGAVVAGAVCHGGSVPGSRGS
jgi:hypothetical protein